MWHQPPQVSTRHFGTFTFHQVRLRVEWQPPQRFQPDGEVRQMLRPGCATDADSLTMAGHVVAVEFATVAAANNYWRD